LTVEVLRDVPLAPRTTLGLGGPAKRFARVTAEAELEEMLRDARRDGERVLVLGGGSNLVVGDEGWDGLVVQIAIDGVVVERHRDDTVVWAKAGVVWDDFVAQMVGAGIAGVECLSGIPGLVGATPMQNVGAYGQEVAETIERVFVLDRQSGERTSFSRADCEFAYRTSKFKGEERYVILEVMFRFADHGESMPIRYAELARALEVSEGQRVALRSVRDTVIRLRRGKGMVIDPGDPESRSAGSFFTNPIVDRAALDRVRRVVGPDVAIPSWPAGDRIKLSAGWLIERAGFAKGYTRGNVGISKKHALALVNRGGATTRELLALAREIQDGVRDRLGIDLVPEPVIA
jgi:UDP-N-acetylmuramate dehydrogenase